jgi:hypothetical protein
LFVDLRDFCDRLIVRYNQIGDYGKVVDLCEKVSEAIDKLVLTSSVAGAAFQFSYGISIYFPWSILSPRYGNLAFPKETHWLDFLRRYHEKTRRTSRLRADEHSRADEKDTFGQPLPSITTNTFRASVPTNKGRNGNVESMRNPPTREFVEFPASRVAIKGQLQTPVDPSPTKDNWPTNGDGKGTAIRAQAETVESYTEVNEESNSEEVVNRARSA